jgi:septal ring factor EnvC (AmiA/AmiB activator)
VTGLGLNVVNIYICVSVTFLMFLFQSAQEKYELQQEGDELDARIRKTEKEIQAMENTLKLINATNENYKRNLFAVDEESNTVIQLMFNENS